MVGGGAGVCIGTAPPPSPRPPDALRPPPWTRVGRRRSKEIREALGIGPGRDPSGMEDHVNGERAYPEGRRFARRPVVRRRRGEPARPPAQAGGLRLDAGAGCGFPGIRIRTAGRLWMAVAAIPARPTCGHSRQYSTRRAEITLVVACRDLLAVDPNERDGSAS